MFEKFSRIKSAGWLPLVIFLSVAGAVVPHENGVLKLSGNRMMAGAEASVVGEKFQGSSKMVLYLVGVDGRVELVEVSADSVGGFRHNVAVPVDVAPGSYRLIAVASDGDIVAGIDIEVLPALEVAGEMPEEEMAADPTAEPLELTRARNPLVTGGVAAGILLSFVLGGVLLARSRNGHA